MVLVNAEVSQNSLRNLSVNTEWSWKLVLDDEHLTVLELVLGELQFGEERLRNVMNTEQFWELILDELQFGEEGLRNVSMTTNISYFFIFVVNTEREHRTVLRTCLGEHRTVVLVNTERLWEWDLILIDSKICQKMNGMVRNYVLLDEFWEMLDLIARFLEPMVLILKLFESDTSTLSTIYSYFKKLMNQISEISCSFSDNIQQLDQKCKNANVETIEYDEFTKFTSKRFGQEESVSLFIELVTFHQKNLPYDNETIWLSTANFISSLYKGDKLMYNRCKYNNKKNNNANDADKNNDNNSDDDLDDNDDIINLCKADYYYTIILYPETENYELLQRIIALITSELNNLILNRLKDSNDICLYTKENIENKHKIYIIEKNMDQIKPAFFDNNSSLWDLILQELKIQNRFNNLTRIKIIAEMNKISILF
ncbi:hypothetical protein C1645_826651 [Glomus cerebriforme]|uniref:Uncharacterized protein n=1 Tax=Glomus cerebriforme TaxID=658196 RepID=A0A397STJ0_9GLOM|nr:hypothetical protein C1645_826651 [Glomus cerebriforme]